MEGQIRSSLRGEDFGITAGDDCVEMAMQLEDGLV